MERMSSFDTMDALGNSLPKPQRMSSMGMSADMESVLTSLLDGTPEFAAAASEVLDNEEYLMDDDRAHFAKRFRDITGISLTNGVAEFVGTAAGPGRGAPLAKAMPTYLSIKAQMCDEFGISSWDDNKHLVTKALENNHADATFTLSRANNSGVGTSSCASMYSTSSIQSDFLDVHARFSERFEEITGQSLDDDEVRHTGKRPPTCKYLAIKRILKEEFGEVIWESKKMQVTAALEKVMINDRRESMNSLDILMQIVNGDDIARAAQPGPPADTVAPSRTAAAGAGPSAAAASLTMSMQPPQAQSSASAEQHHASAAQGLQAKQQTCPVGASSVGLQVTPTPHTSQQQLLPQQQQQQQQQQEQGVAGSAAAPTSLTTSMPPPAPNLAHTVQQQQQQQQLAAQQAYIVQQQQLYAAHMQQCSQQSMPTNPASAAEMHMLAAAKLALQQQQAPGATSASTTTVARAEKKNANSKRPLTEQRRTKKNARERERREEERNLYKNLIRELKLPEEAKADKAVILNAAVDEIQKLAAELKERKAKRQRLNSLGHSNAQVRRADTANSVKVTDTKPAVAPDEEMSEA